MNRTPLSGLDRSAAQQRLRQCPLFAKFKDAQLDTVLQHSSRALLAEGQTLFEQQQPAREIFLLESGQMKLARISPEGQEKIIDLISPGNTFAEAVLFSGERLYPVTASAVIESCVLCFDARTYAGILHQSTDACFAVLAKMSRRLHWQITEIDRLTLHNAAFRLVSYLLEQVPGDHQGSWEVRLDTPKHVIASRLSITPETLSRTFARLTREGYIDIQDEAVSIKDVARLRRYTRGDLS